MQKSISRTAILFTAFLFIHLISTAQKPDEVSDILLQARSYLFNQPDSSLYLIKKANKMAEQTEPEDMAKVNRYFGMYYHVQSKYDTALLYYQKCADLAEDNGLSELYADAVSNMGLALSAQGNLGQAQEKLLEALSYFKQENLALKQANVYNNIGIVLQKSGDLKGAKDTYKKANAVHPEKHLGALSNLATAFENENNLDSALTIYDTLAVAFEKQNNLRSLFSVYSNMGIVYNKLEMAEQTIHYYSLATTLAKRINHQNGLAILYQNRADHYYKRNQFELSYAYLDSGYQAAEQARNLEVFAKLKNREALIFSEMGRYKDAVMAFESYNELRDSLFIQNQAATVQELNIKYETAANKQRIAELQLSQKDVALSLATSKNQRNLFIFGFSILLIGAGFLFYQYRTKKRTSEVLTKKNDQISEALAEREILLKEIHHRVKNNLQVISSLLYLQAESLDDEAAIDAVRQGQHRVEAMGLIHQRLYSADDVRGVDIQSYFEQLCEEIITVFGDEDEEIEYQVETNNLKLDIDTVIPLGLIVNELITNAIKYAFTETDNGQIAIIVNHKEDRLIVQVKDNGVGMTEESLKKANSFGWKMMRSLSRKLEAEIKIKNDSGTTVELIASRYKLVK